MSNSVTVHDVQLRDLASVLRKKSSTQLEVVKFDTEPLLPMGENYGSTILKVHAVVKRNGKEEEELNLVAKLLPKTDFQRLIFDSTYTFKKEAFFYEELIPSYRSLERDFGIPEDELFVIVPEFYGARWSLKGDANEEVDDDAVILMQNLKVLGYYTEDRRKGLDYDHAHVAILALSRFHALGIAMRLQKPDYFEVLKQRSKCLKISESDMFDDATKQYIRILCEDAELAKYSERLNAAMTQETAKTWTAEPPEAWSTIVHSDFWVNNFCFRKDPKTHLIDDIKFVDFQNYLLMTPLRELTFFLTTSLNGEVMSKRFDDLLDCYYENFIRVLERMRCDVTTFSRDKFDERLKIDAYEEFPHCPFMLNIMTATVDPSVKPGEIKDVMFQDQGESPLFLERLRRCVQKFVEKGWL